MNFINRYTVGTFWLILLSDNRTTLLATGQKAFWLWLHILNVHNFNILFYIFIQVFREITKKTPNQCFPYVQSVQNVVFTYKDLNFGMSIKITLVLTLMSPKPRTEIHEIELKSCSSRTQLWTPKFLLSKINPFDDLYFIKCCLDHPKTTWK